MGKGRYIEYNFKVFQKNFQILRRLNHSLSCVVSEGLYLITGCSQTRTSLGHINRTTIIAIIPANSSKY